MFACQEPCATAMLSMLLKEARLVGRARAVAVTLALPAYGGGMKICPVVLLLTLGANADAVLKAQTLPAGQTLPADTVMVASEAMPGGLDLFPELLASSHPALLQGLPMTPAVSEGLPSQPAKTETAPEPLTARDRLILFWNESYASPGAFVGVSAGALVDQLRHTPPKWDGDGSGYTRRFASEYGQLAARNVIHDGLAGATGLDPRYVACKCEGTLRRSGHALKMTFTTYRQDGRLALDVPQLAGAYGSGMISTYWYPHNQFSPLVQGVQFGHEQMGEILIGNLVHEFGPDLERTLHLHALTARRHPRPDDDD
jgi:hypothetical protein